MAQSTRRTPPVPKTGRKQVAGFHPWQVLEQQFKADPPTAHFLHNLSGWGRTWFVSRRLVHATWRFRDLAAVPLYLTVAVPAVRFGMVPWWLAILGLFSAGALGWALWLTQQEKAGKERKQHRAWRQWQAACLDAEFEMIPRLLRYHDRQHADIFVVKQASGDDERKFDRAARKLASHYSTRISWEHDHDGTVTILAHKEDLLADEPQRPEPDQLVDGKIPLGIDQTGAEVTIPFLESSIMLAGRRGSGKSTTFNSLLAYAIRLPHREFRIFDAKGGMDLHWAHQFASQVAPDVDSGMVLLERALMDLHARNAELGRRRLSRVPVGDEFPLVFVCLDEFATLLKPKLDARSKRAMYLIGEINRLGRAAGFITLAATQDIRADVISGELKAQFTHIFGFSVANRTDSITVAGPGSADAKVYLSDIKPAHCGRGYWIGGDPHYLQLRAFRLFGPALAREERLLKAELTLRNSSPGIPQEQDLDVLAEIGQSSSAPSPPPLSPQSPSSQDRVPKRALVLREIARLEALGAEVRTQAIGAACDCSTRYAGTVLTETGWVSGGSSGVWKRPATLRAIG